MKLYVFTRLCTLFTVFIALVAGSSNAHADFRWRLNPELGLDSQYYPSKYTGCPSSPRTDDCIDNYHMIFRLGLLGQAKYGIFKAKLDFQGYFDVNNESPRTYSLGKVFTDSNERSLFFDQEYEYGDFREAYLQANVPVGGEDSELGPLYVRAGRQIFNWAVADGFTPLDVVNSRRYYDLLNAQKLGANAISLQLPHEYFDIEVIYLPVRRKSILPRETSRWLPREAFQDETIKNGDFDARIQITNDTGYQYNSQDFELDNALKSNWGARLRAKMFNIDWSFVYFNGLANTPATVIGTTLTPISTTISEDGSLVSLVLSTNGEPIILAPVFYRRSTVGGGLSFTLWNTIVRYESAYKTTNYNPAVGNEGLPAVVRTVVLPGYSWEHVLGFERSFDVMGNTITALLQFTHVKNEVDSGNTSMGAIFDTAVLAGMLWALGENLALTGSVLYDIEHTGFLTQWSLNWQITQHLSGNLKLAFIEGKDISVSDPDSITPLGTYRRNDSVGIGMTYQF